MKKLIAVTLALSMILTLFSGCGGGGGKTETQTISPEATSATAAGVTVNMGGYILEGETKLTVQKRAAQENKDEGYKIVPYDISVGELTELSDFITIRIPYDDSYCDKGQDASECVGAKYFNETSGEWEDVLYEVDAEAKELVIYTDHLSVYGAFHIKNEGQRSAYITDLYANALNIDPEEAMEALREYVGNGGEEGKASAQLAAKVLAGVDFTAGAAGTASFYTDLIGNIVNFATMNHTEFESPLAKELFDGLGNMGKVMAAVKIGAVMLKTDKTDEDVLGLYKDTANLAMSFTKDKALGMAMIAVFVFDYTISEMFAQGMSIRRGAINEVYRHYNDTYEEGHYKARDLKDWRKALIEAVEKDPENPAAAVEAEIDRYCNAFWNLVDSDFDSVADDFDKKGTKGETTVPRATSDEAKRMTADYKNELYERLYPVINSVAFYMQKKAEAEYLDALGDMKKFLNQTITLSFSEGLGENESTGYANYSLRLEPLSKNADEESWGASNLGEKGPNGKTKFTLIGYITAGAPDTLALYKPGAVPGKDEPEVSVKFKLTAPKTEVTIPRAAQRLEFVPKVYDNGAASFGEVDRGSGTVITQLFEQNPLVIAEDGTFSFRQSESISYSCPLTDTEKAFVKAAVLTLSGFVMEGSCDALGGSEPSIAFGYTESLLNMSADGRSDYTTTWEIVGTGVPTYDYDGKELEIRLQVTTRLYYDGELSSERQSQKNIIFVRK